MKWIGPLRGNKKQQALEVAEFLMLPSDVEPFGIVLLEAMAHGKPVIATATEGARAVIDNALTGFITRCGCVEDLAEAVRKLLTRPDLCAAMGQRARTTVSTTYRTASFVDRIEDLYYTLLNRKNHMKQSSR